MSFDFPGFIKGLTEQRAKELAAQYGTAVQGGVQLSPDSAPYLAGTIQLTANQATSKSLQIPINTRTIKIYTSVNWSSMKAVGDQTGISYVNRTTSDHYTIMPIATAVDTSITITITPTANGLLWLVTDPLALLSGLLTGPAKINASLPVSLATDQGALPWLAPNQAPISWTGAATGIAAVAGKIVYLFGGSIHISTLAAGGGIQLQDTAGTIIWEIGSEGVGNFPFQLNGAPLPVGLGVKTVLVGAPVGRTMLAYSQA